MNKLNLSVTAQDILNARQTIQNVINFTPCDYSKSATDLIGSEIYLKLENTQRTGSFKIRGAINKMKSLTADERAHGVIASSAGNHAQAVALSGTSCPSAVSSEGTGADGCGHAVATRSA